MCIETRPITLQDHNAVEALRARYGHVTASHAFPSLYIWQEDMGLSIALKDSLFVVKCRWRGDNAWFFPCGEPAAVRRFLRKLVAEAPAELRLCYLREEDAAFLDLEFPGQFHLLERPEDDEYLYDRREQTDLKGRRFAALRNHIHRAQADHFLEAVPLEAGNIADALAIQRAWRRNADGPESLTDEAAAETLLRHGAQLNVHGVVILVDGEPYAVAAGYPLSQDSFDIALAKQKSTLSGLSVYAKHALILSLPERFTRLNAEEDLGIEGLRTMKRQMRPSGQIKMFEGRLLPHG